MKARDLIRNGALVQLRCGAICVAISPVFSLSGILIPLNANQRVILYYQCLGDIFEQWMTIEYCNYDRDLHYIQTTDVIENISELDVIKIHPATDLSSSIGLLFYSAEEAIKRFNDNWAYCYNVVDGNAELIQ